MKNSSYIIAAVAFAAFASASPIPKADAAIDFDTTGIIRRQKNVNGDNNGQIFSNTGNVTGGGGDGNVQVGDFGNGNNDFSNNDDTSVDLAGEFGFFKRQNNGNGGQSNSGLGDNSENEGNNGQLFSNSGNVNGGGGSGNTQVGDFANGDNDFSNNGDTTVDTSFGFFKRQDNNEDSGSNSQGSVSDSSENEGNNGQIFSNKGNVNGGGGDGNVQVGDFGNGDGDFSGNGDTSVDTNVGFFKRQSDSSENEGNNGQIFSNSGNVKGSGGDGNVQVGDFGNGNDDFSNNDDTSTSGDFGFFKRAGSSGSSSSGSPNNVNNGNNGQIFSNSGNVSGGGGNGNVQVGDFGNGDDDFSNTGDTSFSADFGFFKRQADSVNANNNGQISSNSGNVTSDGTTQVGNFGNGGQVTSGAPSSCNSSEVSNNSGDINNTDGGTVINGNVGGSIVIIELVGADGTTYHPEVGKNWTAPTQLTSNQWSGVNVASGHSCSLTGPDGGVQTLGEGSHTIPKTVIKAVKCL